MARKEQVHRKVQTIESVQGYGPECWPDSRPRCAEGSVGACDGWKMSNQQKRARETELDAEERTSGCSELSQQTELESGGDRRTGCEWREL